MIQIATALPVRSARRRHGRARRLPQRARQTSVPAAARRRVRWVVAANWSACSNRSPRTTPPRPELSTSSFVGGTVAGLAAAGQKRVSFHRGQPSGAARAMCASNAASRSGASVWYEPAAAACTAGGMRTRRPPKSSSCSQAWRTASPMSTPRAIGPTVNLRSGFERPRVRGGGKGERESSAVVLEVAAGPVDLADWVLRSPGDANGDSIGQADGSHRLSLCRQDGPAASDCRCIGFRITRVLVGSD
jgi:hypothetical protein